MDKSRRGRIRRMPSSGSDSDGSTAPPSCKKKKIKQVAQSESDVEEEYENVEYLEEENNRSQEVSNATAPRSQMSRARQTNSNTSQRTSSFNLSSELSIPSAFDRCGKVISMRLTNFMCHSNLFVEFGPNINFLVGNNGSGKSAVITALALGLTSSARATNRASSIQKLIKNGEASATIAITLSNTGLRPFKADIFGPHLTVVRQIRHSSSTYDLQDARGKSVSKKVAEIRRMLLCFGINVENPIFVLNQEAAREFLKELEPASNYKLLMKATQLDVCTSSLTECHAQRRHFTQDLEQLEKKRDVVAKQVEAEEEKLSILKDKEIVKVKLEQCKAKLAWMAVTRFQEDLDNLEHSIKLIESKKAKLELTTSKKESSQASMTQQLSEFEATKNQILSSYKVQDEKLRTAKRAVQDILIKISSIKAQIGNAERRMREDQHAYDECVKLIGNYHADFKRVKEQREEHVNKMGALKKQVADSEETIARLREEQLQIKRDITSVQERVEALKNERVQLHKSKQKISMEIEELSRNKSNKLSVYGEQAIQVVHALRTQYAGSNMHRMPRGPLGQYISAPNPKYRDLVENQLMGCLRSFIVSSDKERQSLRTLLQNKFQGGNMPSIITSPFTDRVYDVSRNKVRPTTPNTTVLIDEISCDDPVVMNYLIDMLRIETVLVTESKEIAEFLTSDTENVPPNLTRVLVPSLGLEYIPSPNYAVYSTKIHPARYIHINVDDRIRQLHMEQRDLEEKYASLEMDYMQHRQVMEKTQHEIAKKVTMIGQHQSRNERAMQQIMELENFDYQELPEYDRLESHLAQSGEKIEKCKQEREMLEQKLNDIQERKSELEATETVERQALAEINHKLSTLDTEAREVESKIRSLDLHYEENTRNLQKTLQLERKMIEEKQTIQNDLEQARVEAQKVGDFIGTSQTEEKIRELISRYKSKIKQVEQLNYNPEEVERGLSKLRDELGLQARHLAVVDSVIKKLRMAYHQRAQLFQRSRHHYFTMVQFQFEQALAMRQFKASFETSDKDKTWKINVFPPSGNETSNARSLSGGERSFTTVSLLKGLWSTSDHPFYFLDEYDVFTDEVNRKFITEILIGEGMEWTSRQYCFLTPQDTAVEASSFITVHKLEAPDR
ncbi:structural maintenance of chromosomes protein 6 [Drosophila ficusphila]|uniref:structural maintenance of chromosomes protein 6 n=1 Tax=Drosophila ficusphila TaxID=30025 RepID=UPI0007E85EEE|nr:structural maintenance of chromosomes protein 6 [Drosophila ficusphila]XP_017047220.1 structural maintenance of chromosomes protein 6 [Drosophila ficusphila]